MSLCGCPGAYRGGPVHDPRTWHLHPVTCSGCGVLARYVYVTPGGLHTCPTCHRSDQR